jgi:transmembrane sensor
VAPAASTPAPTAAASAPSSTPSAAPATPAADWQALSRRGEYQEAYAAARARGIPEIAQSGSASELFALAETCRLSGHGREAVAVLSRLRARFASSEEAAVAAFQLGRVTGGGAASAEWFGTYLNERPGGKLAREACGRLLEALHRGGKLDEARAAARRYLARYPSGPHAEFAARILND